MLDWDAQESYLDGKTEAGISLISFEIEENQPGDEGKLVAYSTLIYFEDLDLSDIDEDLSEEVYDAWVFAKAQVRFSHWGHYHLAGTKIGFTYKLAKEVGILDVSVGDLYNERQYHLTEEMDITLDEVFTGDDEIASTLRKYLGLTKA